MAKCTNEIAYAWPNKVLEVPTTRHTQNGQGKTPTNLPRLEVQKPLRYQFFPGWYTAQKRQKQLWRQDMAMANEQLQQKLRDARERLISLTDTTRWGNCPRC